MQEPTPPQSAFFNRLAALLRATRPRVSRKGVLVSIELVGGTMYRESDGGLRIDPHVSSLTEDQVLNRSREKQRPIDASDLREWRTVSRALELAAPAVSDSWRLTECYVNGGVLKLTRTGIVFIPEVNAPSSLPAVFEDEPASETDYDLIPIPRLHPVAQEIKAEVLNKSILYTEEIEDEVPVAEVAPPEWQQRKAGTFRDSRLIGSPRARRPDDKRRYLKDPLGHGVVSYGARITMRTFGGSSRIRDLRGNFTPSLQTLQTELSPRARSFIGSSGVEKPSKPRHEVVLAEIEKFTVPNPLDHTPDFIEARINGVVRLIPRRKPEGADERPRVHEDVRARS